MAKQTAREAVKKSIHNAAAESTGIHSNRVRTFVGDRTSGKDLIDALMLEKQRKVYAQDRDINSPTWGHLIEVEGIDF